MSSNENEGINLQKLNKLNDYRVWQQQKNTSHEYIIPRISQKQKNIKDNTDQLNEEEHFYYRKKINTESNNKKSSNKSQNPLLSNVVQKIMLDVKRSMKSIDDSTAEITKINSLNFSPVPTTKSIPNIATQPSTRSNSKGKQTLNFKYVNDNYRKQLNRAFLNFNPIIHLGNLNILRKADPEINADIEKLTKHINDDLEEITSDHYYRNKYLKIVEQGEKMKEREKRLHDNNKEITMPTAETEPSKGTNNTTNNKYTVNMYQGFRKRNKNKNMAEIKKKFPDRELEEKTLDLLECAMDKLSGTISDENMNKYFAEHNYFYGKALKQQEHQYFSGIAKCGNILKEIQHERIVRDLIEKTNRRKKVLTNENAHMINDLLHAKGVLLKEIEQQEKK